LQQFLESGHMIHGELPCPERMGYGPLTLKEARRFSGGIFGREITPQERQKSERPQPVPLGGQIEMIRDEPQRAITVRPVPPSASMCVCRREGERCLPSALGVHGSSAARLTVSITVPSTTGDLRTQGGEPTMPGKRPRSRTRSLNGRSSRCRPAGRSSAWGWPPRPAAHR